MAGAEQDGMILIPEIDGERVIVDEAIEAKNRGTPHGGQPERGGGSRK